MARVAGALGMQLLVHDPALPASQFEGVERVEDAGELLARSDFVSLHARVTPDNENLMDAAAFARMRPGAFFVNTARETLVDEAALLAAIRAGRLLAAQRSTSCGRSRAGAATRCWTSPWLSPRHIGGATAETIERGVAMVADEIARLADGREPAHPR